MRTTYRRVAIRADNLVLADHLIIPRMAGDTTICVTKIDRESDPLYMAVTGFAAEAGSPMTVGVHISSFVEVYEVIA